MEDRELVRQRLLEKLRKTEGDIEQMLRDAEYWMKHSIHGPKSAPLDLEPEKIALYGVRQAIGFVERCTPVPDDIWQTVIDQMSTQVK